MCVCMALVNSPVGKYLRLILCIGLIQGDKTTCNLSSAVRTFSGTWACLCPLKHPCDGDPNDRLSWFLGRPLVHAETKGSPPAHFRLAILVFCLRLCDELLRTSTPSRAVNHSLILLLVPPDIQHRPQTIVSLSHCFVILLSLTLLRLSPTSRVFAGRGELLWNRHSAGEASISASRLQALHDPTAASVT